MNLKRVKVVALYDIRGLFSQLDKHKLRLTKQANRHLLFVVLMKIGPASGQKIVKKMVEKGELTWSDENFEVEAVLDHTVEEGIDYYMIKWKGWSNDYNTWEPKTNLDCPELLKSFHATDNVHSQFLSRKSHKRPLDTTEGEPVTKRKKVDELIQHIFRFNSKISALDLLDACDDYRKYSYRLMSLKQTSGGYGAAANKRTKAYKTMKTEVHTALKLWEDELNRINTDPAKIYVENKVDLEGPPQNFHYINDYMPGDGVMIHTTPVVGCECKDCYAEKRSCCSASAGTMFAYRSNGRLSLPHGFPIYECNKLCSCDETCPNRVVQLGRKYKVCIFRTSNGRGWGVKARQKIQKGSFVMEYVGEVITNEEAERRGKNYDAEGMTYLFDLDYQDPDSQFTVDAKIYGNVSHFVNHSCDPNLAVYGVWINNLDPRLPRIALFASRDIASGEELTFDYLMTGELTETTDKIQLMEVTDKRTVKHDTEDCVVTETLESPMMTPILSDNISPLDVTSESINKITNDIDTVSREGNYLNNFMAATGINCSCEVKGLKEFLPSSTNDTATNVIESARIPSVEEGSELGEHVSSSLTTSISEEENHKNDENSVTGGGEEEMTPFFHRSKFSSPPMKYRLKCQCGAKKCRKFLY